MNGMRFGILADWRSAGNLGEHGSRSESEAAGIAIVPLAEGEP